MTIRKGFLDPIINKIREVGDGTCQVCSQMFNRECRAFEVPASAEEYRSRMKGPRHPMHDLPILGCDDTIMVKFHRGDKV